MLFQECQVLAQPEIDQIVEMALKVLEEEGCVFELESSRKKLKEAGANIHAQNRIRIPADILWDIIAEFQEAYHRPNAIGFMMGQAPLWYDPSKKQNLQGALEIGRKLAKFGQKSPYITAISSGIELPNMEEWLEALPTLTQKPIYLGQVHPESLQELKTVLSDKTSAQAKLQFCISIQASAAFAYKNYDLGLLEWASENNHALYFKSNYRPGLGIPVASVLALQLAETLAGIYYIICLQSKSPVLMTATSLPETMKPDSPDLFDFFNYDLALIQLAHFLGIPVAIPLFPIRSLDFLGATPAALQRMLLMLAKPDQCMDMGVSTNKVFNPMQLLLEHEWISYWRKVTTMPASIEVKMDPFLQDLQMGKFNPKPMIWDGEYFCYDELEFWRKKRMSFTQYLTTQLAQKWQTLEAS